MIGNILRGERLRLTALSAADIPMLVRWWEDGTFLRLFDAEPAYPFNEQQMADKVEQWRKEPGTFMFAARPLDGDELIAFAELDGIVWSQRTGWISISIGDPARRGQGFGAEALRLLLSYAFDELNLYRVQLTVFSYNPGAIRLYEKLGFAREGVLREAIHRDGARHDMLVYGLLRREWEAHQAGPTPL